jgi:DNA-binding SARP family transcriptional activator
MEVMWPNASVRRAGERLSTEVADVRRRIRQAAGDTPQPSQGKRSPSAPRLQPVVNSGSRYHLDPAIVDIDLWQLTDALRAAASATDRDTRIAALQHAIDLHTGTLADGVDYDWIDQPREHLRRQGLRARVHLADLLTEDDPHRALRLYQDAGDLDPINEEVARRTMKAMAVAGDTDGIRARLDQLRAALDTIDEEPSAETIDMVNQLQRDIVRRDRPAIPRHGNL